VCVDQEVTHGCTIRLIRPAPLRRGMGALSLAGYLWTRAAYERR
jgi:hypothetical protein